MIFARLLHVFIVYLVAVHHVPSFIILRHPNYRYRTCRQPFAPPPAQPTLEHDVLHPAAAPQTPQVPYGTLALASVAAMMSAVRWRWRRSHCWHPRFFCHVRHLDQQGHAPRHNHEATVARSNLLPPPLVVSAARAARCPSGARVPAHCASRDAVSIGSARSWQLCHGPAGAPPRLNFCPSCATYSRPWRRRPFAAL